MKGNTYLIHFTLLTPYFYNLFFNWWKSGFNGLNRCFSTPSQTLRTHSRPFRPNPPKKLVDLLARWLVDFSNPFDEVDDFGDGFGGEGVGIAYVVEALDDAFAGLEHVVECGIAADLRLWHLCLDGA